MSKQVTIKLSDGTPHTGTLDQDGFLLLPRGAKPAEPWWSKCQAQFGRCNNLPDCANEWLPCSAWHWDEPAWFRIHPLPNHTWESIAPQQPATPKRDYSEWVEGSWFDIRPNDFEQDKYETEFEWGGEWLVELNPDIAGWHVMRVRLRRPPRQPARDYTNWQEGLGDSAKPEDYDQQPGKYGVERRIGGDWEPCEPCWYPDYRYRVRLRQSEPQGQKTFLRVDKGGPFDTQPQGESESDFMRRVLLPCICRIGVAKGCEHVEFNTTRLDRPDALRLARLIAEAKA